MTYCSPINNLVTIEQTKAYHTKIPNRKANALRMHGSA